jgi:hypothetical protein
LHDDAREAFDSVASATYADAIYATLTSILAALRVMPPYE